MDITAGRILTMAEEAVGAIGDEGGIGDDGRVLPIYKIEMTGAYGWPDGRYRIAHTTE